MTVKLKSVLVSNSYLSFLEHKYKEIGHFCKEVVLVNVNSGIKLLIPDKCMNVLYILKWISI